MSAKAYCADCSKRETCKKPCQEVEKLIKQTHLWEKNERKRIILYPERGVTRFSAMQIKNSDGDKDPETFSNEDAIQFRTDDLELTKTSVFFEHFFNRVPFEDIADRLGISIEAAYAYFERACETIETLTEVMDRKGAAEKYVMGRGSYNKFSYDEKAFLLNHVFGYTTREIAEILGKYGQGSVKVKVRKMREKYRDAFDQVA